MVNLVKSGKLDKYRPKTPLLNEKKVCMKYQRCFDGEQFNLFEEKVCESCGKYSEIHYHDVIKNIRLCVPCFTKSLESNTEEDSSVE